MILLTDSVKICKSERSLIISLCSTNYFFHKDFLTFYSVKCCKVFPSYICNVFPFFHNFAVNNYKTVRI